MATRKKKTDEPIQPPIHLEEYLASRSDISEAVKAGFRIFMRGKQYQKGFDDFDKELKNYFNRKL